MKNELCLIGLTQRYSCQAWGLKTWPCLISKKKKRMIANNYRELILTYGWWIRATFRQIPVNRTTFIDTSSPILIYLLLNCNPQLHPKTTTGHLLTGIWIKSTGGNFDDLIRAPCHSSTNLMSMSTPKTKTNWFKKQNKYWKNFLLFDQWRNIIKVCE